MRTRIFLLLFIVSGVFFRGFSQPVPAHDENIPYLVTFGGDACPSWGDDNFTQIFFFLIPEEHTDPVFIRVFNPGTSGSIDELNGYWDTKVNFSVYGGEEAWSDPDAQETAPAGNYRSGNLLASKTFGNEPEYDGTWYTFGPFDPMEGEYVEKFRGNIFKIIAQGVEGDDGNLYRYFLSTQPDQNIAVEGGNAFAYSYTFRLWDDPRQVSSIYPFIDEETISVRVSNFDWDSDGMIRLVSVDRQGQLLKISDDNEWAEDEFAISPDERNTSLHLQFHKQANPVVRNNNVVVNIRNQYDQALPFYVIPIGGVPQYKYSIGVRPRGN
jgi:hypothetical protein